MRKKNFDFFFIHFGFISTVTNNVKTNIYISDTGPGLRRSDEKPPRKKRIEQNIAEIKSVRADFSQQ